MVGQFCRHIDDAEHPFGGGCGPLIGFGQLDQGLYRRVKLGHIGDELHEQTERQAARQHLPAADEVNDNRSQGHEKYDGRAEFRLGVHGGDIGVVVLVVPGGES